jgi:hypothetical protein
MRTILFFSLFVLIATHSFSQEESLPFQNSRWTYYFQDEGSSNYLTFYVDGDTILNEEARSNVYAMDDIRKEPVLIGFLHAVEKKIYFRIPEEGLSSSVSGFFGFTLESNKDFLIYDFSLEEGDEFLCPPTMGGWESKKYIHAVDSVELGVEKRKRYTVKRDPEAVDFDDYWIEGMGNSNGLFYLGVEEWVTCECFRKFVCYSENDETLYLAPGYDECPDFSIFSGMEAIDKEGTVTLSPNPMEEMAKVKSQNPIQEIRLYDIKGSLVEQIICNGELEYTLLRRSIPSGVYALMVVFQDKKSEVRKLIVK